MTPETSNTISTVSAAISAICALIAVALVLYGWKIAKKQSDSNSSRSECRSIISQIWALVDTIEDVAFKHYCSAIDDTQRTRTLYNIKSLVARLDRLVNSFCSYVEAPKLNTFDSYYNTVTNRLYDKEQFSHEHAIHIEIQQASTKLIEEIDSKFFKKNSPK